MCEEYFLGTYKICKSTRWVLRLTNKRPKTTKCRLFKGKFCFQLNHIWCSQIVTVDVTWIHTYIPKPMWVVGTGWNLHKMTNTKISWNILWSIFLQVNISKYTSTIFREKKSQYSIMQYYDAGLDSLNKEIKKAAHCEKKRCLTKTTHQLTSMKATVILKESKVQVVSLSPVFSISVISDYYLISWWSAFSWRYMCEMRMSNTIL